MIRTPFIGLRGRITWTVLAVTAVVFSGLAALGFSLIAAGGRDAVRERVTGVADSLATSISSGAPATGLTTADGVTATVVPVRTRVVERPGEIVVTRTVRLGGDVVRVVARSAEAPLTDSLRSLHRTLWVGVPLASIVSALLAGFATKRTLAPVDDIVRIADSIGSVPGGRRVPEPGAGDELDRLARTINRMLDRIDSGQQAQRRFTSDAAHELRTPLMALQGELELLGRGVEPLSAAAVERLSQQCERLGGRIDDLVLLSTIDEGRPARRGPVDLGALVAAEASAVAPTVELPSLAHPVVECDEPLLARAVRNLVANAARHAASRVVATVEVEPGSDRVWVHVDDDGPGIAPADREAAFARFGRLDEARSTDTGGAGLGLAVVASVASAHGGGATIDDSPCGGARVSIWVPAAAR